MARASAKTKSPANPAAGTSAKRKSDTALAQIHPLSPYLVCDGAAKAVEFYEDASDAAWRS
jgi:hypothetical protein